MNSRPLRLLLFIASVLPVLTFAADAPVAAIPAKPAVSDPAKELTALQDAIVVRLKKGFATEQDFPTELLKFDQLVAEHAGDKSDAVAKILLTKAALYLQIFDDKEKAVEALHQLVAQFPGTPSADTGVQALPDLEKFVAGAAIEKTLVLGAQFPDFAVKDLDGQPLSVASYQGKVVLIDFWATWCGPCMEEMPNVIAAYKKYHDRGFEIIGVSLDHENLHDQLVAFLKQNNMPWRQYYDGKYWDNALAVKYGVTAHGIPMSYLLDGTGKIIALEPRGPALAPAIEAALAKK